MFSIACQSPKQEKNVASTEEASQEEQNLSQNVSQPEDDSVIEIELSTEALLGKIEPAKDSSFVRIASQYTNKDEIYLRKQTYEDFVRMAKAAREDDVSLQIISATRNFAVQKSIWEAKWNGQRKVDGMDLSQAISDPQERALKILEYSSMPGTSRHHWGTDIDLNALSNSYFASGEGKKVYDWLLAHAHEYGFCQVYTEKGDKRPHGYNEERWHWSYMPLASQFLKQYNEKISYAELGGFDGGSVAEEIEAIRKYVNGIAPRCMNW
ncbi:M15 family metallopeptidase [Catalinimonas sp. 4WD22]|uniref:M15 family metallopeptidase n=1 Tax=Catalinimonas locisalis TaxID=3133978 RepID=UPI003101A196